MISRTSRGGFAAVRHDGWRLHPETNENRHKRTAQHIGPPRRGVPACPGCEYEIDVTSVKNLPVFVVFFRVVDGKFMT